MGEGQAWLHPGWSWTVGRAWVITALSASVTLILGAVLGALPALLGGSWHDAQTRDQTWVLLVFAAVSLAAAVIAIALSRKRRWVLRQNGTAYVIQEFAAAWDSQDERAFLDSAGRYFARVITVPGPGRLGRAWDWPLGEGAQRWDGKVTDLAHSFLALASDDDQGTPRGIFIWAWWAVAAAFGMQVTASHRDLVLDVWQRPSHGRAGHVEPITRQQRPHRFGRTVPAQLTELPPGATLLKFDWPGSRPSLVGHTLPVLQPGAASASSCSAWGARGGDRCRTWTPDRDLVTRSSSGSRTRLASASAGRQRWSSENCGASRQMTASSVASRPSLVTACAEFIERKASELQGHLCCLARPCRPRRPSDWASSQARCPAPDGPIMWPLVYRASTVPSSCRVST